MWVSRIAALKGNASVMEMAAIPRFHAMLKEIWETGELSDKHHAYIMDSLEKLNQLAEERVHRMETALRNRQANAPENNP
jgi:hypothetical protein